MGSAIGRRKCNMSFFRRGYAAGKAGRKGDVLPDDNMVWHLSGTVSASMGGLWKKGFTMGVEDRQKNIERPYPYHDYRCAKDGLAPTLKWLDDGFTVDYDPNPGFKDHPFTLTNGGGGIIYRRSRDEISEALMAAECGHGGYKYRRPLMDVMERAKKG